jgi:hypothetical protein
VVFTGAKICSLWVSIVQDQVQGCKHINAVLAVSAWLLALACNTTINTFSSWANLFGHGKLGQTCLMVMLRRGQTS